MSTPEIVGAVLRAAHVAALASLLGTLTFLLVVAPSAIKEAHENGRGMTQRLLRVARFSAILALISGTAWLVTETAFIAGAGGTRMTLHALPLVAVQTQFGRWLLPRLGLILVMLLMLRSRRYSIVIATALTAACLAVQPMLGHAGAIGGSVGTTVIVSEIIHLLAAGAWLGGLLPLFITIRGLPHGAGAIACRNFTPVGLCAVLLLGGTAIVQVAEFMGGLAGLFGTGYGQIALAKLALFMVLLTLAILNRLVLTERLAEATADTARLLMRTSIALEATLGMGVVILAAFLASRTPATHEQPVWPFAWRPSLAVIADVDLRWEMIGALIALGGGCFAAAVALLWRPVRWPAAFAAIAAFLFAIPHLHLLFVPAYPTSFFTSPTEFAATAIAHGAKLFSTNCAVCHEFEGRGGGPAAKAQPIPPADLTANHLWSHSDGELFWFISHGIEAPNGHVAMPGFESTLSTEGRWDLIDYLRAHNAGVSMRTTGNWSHPVPVPQFDVTCPTGRTIDLDDLRGQVLRIVAVSNGEATMPSPDIGTDVTTVILDKDRAGVPNLAVCIAREPEAWTAFAILSGVSGAELAGQEMLVDQNGWLRAAWRLPDLKDFSGSQRLRDTIHAILAYPITADTTGVHTHRH